MAWGVPPCLVQGVPAGTGVPGASGVVLVTGTSEPNLRDLMIAELADLMITLPDGRTVYFSEEISAHIADQILTAKSLADFIPAVCICPRGRDDFDYAKAGTHHNPDRCPLWMLP